MGRIRAITAAEKEILLEGLEDHIGLWEFVVAITREIPSGDEPAVKRGVITMAEDLLERGLMVAGFPDERGNFDAVGEDATGIASRIDREWEELGRPPDIGEIVWFDLTESGERYARELDKSQALADH